MEAKTHYMLPARLATMEICDISQSKSKDLRARITEDIALSFRLKAQENARGWKGIGLSLRV